MGRGLVLAIVLAGCYQRANEASCTVACGPGGECPSGLACELASHSCVHEGDTCTAPVVDAGQLCVGHVLQPQICAPPGTYGTLSVTTTTLIDETACTLLLQQTLGDPVCVMIFDQVTVTAQLTATGMYPLALVALGDMTVSGRVDAGSHSAGTLGPGAVSPSCLVTAAPDFAGGPGGSFGTTGGDGGGAGSATVVATPAVPPDALAAGCPGASGGQDPNITGGGGLDGVGGGAIALVAGGTLDVSSSYLSAGGAGASGGIESGGGGGGGAGGMILLDASTIIATNAVIVANGGGGGGGGSLGASGGPGDDGGSTVAALGGSSGDTGAGGNGSYTGSGMSGGPSGASGGGGGGGGAGAIWIYGAPPGGAMAISPAPIPKP